jgi:PAS domain S-box-containing protein
MKSPKLIWLVKRSAKTRLAGAYRGEFAGRVVSLVRTRRGKMAFEYLSPGCEELFGLAPEAIQNDIKPLWELMAPEERRAFRSSVLRSSHTLSPWSQEFHIQRAGSVRVLQAQSRPHRRTDGTTVWDGLVFDVTESRHTRQLLEASRRAFDEVQHLAHLGSYRWNRATGEIIWSDEMFRLHGYAPGEIELSIEAVRGLIHPDDREAIRLSACEAMRVGQTITTRVRILRRDGVERVLESYLSPEKDEHGQLNILTGFGARHH